MNRKYGIQNAPSSHQKVRKKTMGYGRRGKNRAQNLFHVVLFVMENRFLERKEVTPTEAKNKVKNAKTWGCGELKNYLFFSNSQKKNQHQRTFIKWQTWKLKEMWMRIITKEPKDWKWKGAKKKRKEKKRRWKRTTSYMKWFFFLKEKQTWKAGKTKNVWWEILCGAGTAVLMSSQHAWNVLHLLLCPFVVARQQGLAGRYTAGSRCQPHIWTRWVVTGRPGLSDSLLHLASPSLMMMTSLSQSMCLGCVNTLQVLGPGYVYRIAQSSCQGSRSLSTAHLSSQESAGEPHHFLRGNVVFFGWWRLRARAVHQRVFLSRTCIFLDAGSATILVVWQLVFTEHIIAQSCYTSPNNISTFP